MRKFMALLETCDWSYQWILLWYIGSDFWHGINSNVFGCKNLWILWFYELCDEFSCYLIIDISDLKVIIFEFEVVLRTQRLMFESVWYKNMDMILGLVWSLYG